MADRTHIMVATMLSLVAIILATICINAHG